MVKRVSVSVVRKEESGFFAPQLHHNAPQFTTHSSRQNKKYYSPLSLGRGRAEGWDTNTAVNFQNSLSIVFSDRGHLP